MKAVLWACLFATVAAAPTILEGVGSMQDPGLASQVDYLRGRRSHINPYAITPCAAAAAAASSHHHGYTPGGYQYQPGMYPQSYAYVSPSYSPYQRIYRDNPFEEEQEMMSFSDTDLIEPVQRHAYSYEVPQAVNTHPASYVPPSPAYGIFPNANVGNCGVPLLFSCSPSIVKGRVVKAQPQVYTVPEGSSHLDGYREVDMHQPDAHASNHNEVVEHLGTSEGNQGTGKH